MCWKTEIGRPVSHKACKDIICYKIVPNVAPDPAIVYSKIWHFEYHINKLYKTDLGKVIEQPYYYSINEGFHSFKNLPILWRNFYVTFNNEFYNIHYNSIIECVIPTDSTYYENEVGEIVSNQIKVTKVCVGILTKNQS